MQKSGDFDLKISIFVSSWTIMTEFTVSPFFITLALTGSSKPNHPQMIFLESPCLFALISNEMNAEK
jgi:hypothetical protein